MSPPSPAPREAANAACRIDNASATGRLIWLLPVHALVWTLAARLSRGNLDIQGDMIENYAWGIEWQAGYKHPPLFAWITAAWFRVFPHSDIAYFVLSALNAMTGLLGIVALAGCFVPRRVAVIAGVAMAVSPLYSNLAIKFNANSVLLSVWPWTAYFFVRFMQTRSRRAAIALGALAGLAVLGKYFSVVLLIALALASLARPAWRARLADWRALLAVAACAAVIAPHVHWLFTNHFPTLAYADKRTGGTLLAAVARFGIYTLAQIGYLALSFVATLMMVQVRRGQAAQLMAQSVVRPSLNPDLWWLALGPLIVVGILALAAKTQMASVWGMAQWFAIVPLWLAVLERAGFTLRPERAVRMFAGYWLIVLVATATVGYVGARRNTDDAAEPRAELAAAAHALWNERFGHGVPIAAGSTHEARSVTFYSEGRTRHWDMFEPETTPWLSMTDLRKQGALFVCRDGDTSCIEKSKEITGVTPVRIAVHKRSWGRDLPAHDYVLFVLAPERAPGDMRK
ncbi:glycosyltransferase [Burkholderia sp. KK1]|nr:glycosyltransferase [Burkholderia sp. KK1]